MNNKVTVLDSLNSKQRAAYSRSIFGHIALKDTAATRLLMARILKTAGGAK